MWLRKVSVEVTSDDNSVHMLFGYKSTDTPDTPTHRIDFEYHSVMGWAGDYGTITLYNLSSEEIKSLQRKTHGALNIKLSVGYVDSSGISDYMYDSEDATLTVFVGSITNAVSYKRLPENIVHLYCVPQQVSQVTQISLGDITIGAQAGATLEDAIKLLTSQAGLGYKTSGVSSDLLSYKFSRGRAFHGTFIQEVQKLCAEFNMNFSLQPSFIEFYPSSIASADIVNEIATEREPIVVTPGQVIENPVAGIAILELSMNLNPTIMPGMLIDVSKLISPDGVDTTQNYISYNLGYAGNIDNTVMANGMSSLYQIVSLVHHGSTHAQNFQTDITGNYGVDTTMGAIERNWREWCASAYGDS